MNKLKKLFGGISMPWGRVLLLAVLSAVLTAGLNCIPGLENTSLRDIAVNLDCWFVFAILIVVNCDRWWEAALKCFVFFLVSQPLIYLLEVPFNPEGWGLFRYYGYWFRITLLTLPGAAAAYLLKRKDWLSVPVLGVAVAYFGVMSVTYLRSAAAAFPHHLLSAVFCLTAAVLLTLALLDQPKHRIALLLLLAASAAVTAALTVPNRTVELTLEDGDWRWEMTDETLASVELSGENRLRVTAKHEGNGWLSLIRRGGGFRAYDLSVVNGTLLTALVNDADEPLYDQLLVNQTHPLSDGFDEAPELTETTDYNGDPIQIERRALEAYERLRETMLTDYGIELGIDSCYRSIEEQRRIMEDFTERYGEEYAKSTVAEPGTSEHHTGLAVDIVIRRDGSWITENEDLLKETEIFSAIHSHLAEFGFILRYPEGGEAATGCGYEPWHLRYLGTTAAYAVQESGLTLDEFFG